MDRLVKCLECDALLESGDECDCETPWIIIISAPTKVNDTMMREVLKQVLHDNTAMLADRDRELIQRKLIALAP